MNKIQAEELLVNAISQIQTTFQNHMRLREALSVLLAQPAPENPLEKQNGKDNK
jgi:hypothetical protein